MCYNRPLRAKIGALEISDLRVKRLHAAEIDVTDALTLRGAAVAPKLPSPT